MDHREIDCSFDSILKITVPMIVLLLSQNLMYFVDRIILAKHSVTAMYAAVVSGNFVALITWVFVGVATASEILVGQNNGQKRYDKLAVPVWQMVWMSCISSVIIFIPLGYFSEHLNFLPEYALRDGIDYQKPLFYFGFLPSLIAGLSAFFVGQGKTKAITVVSVIGNIVNAILSYYLVISIGMGAYGAAVGTVISEILQLIILAVIFVSSKNREIFRTIKSYAFDKRVFIDCFKVGLPISIGHFFTILSWYLISTSMGYASKELGTIWGMAVNMYVLISFVSEGLNKSIMAISSNLIGKNDLSSIQVVFKRFNIILLIFIIIVSIPTIFYPDIILSGLNLISDEVAELGDQMKVAIRLNIPTFLVDAMCMITYGVLLSGGDSRYPLLISQGCMWTLIVLPLSVILYLDKLLSVNILYYLMFISYTINFILLYNRYKSNKWFKLLQN